MDAIRESEAPRLVANVQGIPLHAHSSQPDGECVFGFVRFKLQCRSRKRQCAVTVAEAMLVGYHIHDLRPFACVPGVLGTLARRRALLKWWRLRFSRPRRAATARA